MRVVLIALAVIATCVRGGRGDNQSLPDFNRHKKVQIIEQEVVNLRDNLTVLWEIVGNLQLQLEHVERENNRSIHHHHHHHHYHHRYYVVVNNDTVEDTNGTLDLQTRNDHELSFEREQIPTDGEHHQHHHHVYHHHSKHNDQNNETDSENPNKCNASFNGIGSPVEDDDSEETLAKAICHVRPNRALPANERQNVRGIVHFRQKLNRLVISINLRGFITTPEHAPLDTTDQLESNQNGQLLALHVHEFGDLSNGCESAGGYYKVHADSEQGVPESKNIGDFGNLECDTQGKLEEKLTDLTASLAGTHSIIGKTLVIHENPKSESSLTNGNSGRRLACCIITKEDD